MARGVPLDKILKQGTPITLEKREAWIIQAIGTNSTTRGRLVIDGKPTGDIVQLIAPLHTLDTNLLGPLPLGDYYYVVPPETKVEWQGATGSKARIIGTKVIFDPGENLGEPYATRSRNQYSSYITYIEGTFSKGTDVAWPAGEENEVISLTPLTIEKYIFDSILMATVANVSGGVSEGDWSITFYIDNTPLENIVASGEQVGVDVLSAPRPPADGADETPFTLQAFPIELTGDHNLSIRVKNTSGASKSPPAGASITATVTVLTKYFKPLAP